MAKLIFQVSWIYLNKELITWKNFGPCWNFARRIGLKKAPITWDISARAETEIETEPRREFFDSLLFVVLAIYIFSGALSES